MTDQVQTRADAPLCVVKCGNGATVRIMGSYLPVDPAASRRRGQVAQAIANEILDRVARERYKTNQAAMPG